MDDIHKHFIKEAVRSAVSQKDLEARLRVKAREEAGDCSFCEQKIYVELLVAAKRLLRGEGFDKGER